jgi:hypothetical protein
MQLNGFIHNHTVLISRFYLQKCIKYSALCITLHFELIKGSVGPFITVQYNGSVEASKQVYSKGSLGPYIKVRYNG